jgi:hypothetical protein
VVLPTSGIQGQLPTMSSAFQSLAERTGFEPATLYGHTLSGRAAYRSRTFPDLWRREQESDLRTFYVTPV